MTSNCFICDSSTAAGIIVGDELIELEKFIELNALDNKSSFSVSVSVSVSFSPPTCSKFPCNLKNLFVIKIRPKIIAFTV